MFGNSHEYFVNAKCRCYLFMYTALVMFDYNCRDSEVSYLRGTGIQSAPPKEGAGIFNVPEDNTHRTRNLHL